jgi:superfamily II DNA/RNA helicase
MNLYKIHIKKKHYFRYILFMNTDKVLENEVQIVQSFEDMNLKINLLRGIFAYGFETPSRIQSLAINLISERKDIIAQSQSGTGKTGTFAIGALNIIDETKQKPQVLIMAPTRELAVQIESVIKDLCKFMKIRTALCVGGIPVDKNGFDASHSHILIGTPGRIYDLISKKLFKAEEIKLLIMDEADELLNRDFKEQTKAIILSTSDETQICIFSATLSEEAISLTKNFLNDPVKLTINRENLTLDLIQQFYIYVDQEKNKLDKLEELYSKLSINQCIIYVNGRQKAEWLKEKLLENQHIAEAIHGSMLPIERTNVMKNFRSGSCRVLISTDLLARGIDVQQVGYVVNYDIPNEIHCYLHRIGRSGRYGKKGVAINLVSNREIRSLQEIEEYYKTSVTEMTDTQQIIDYLSAK